MDYQRTKNYSIIIYKANAQNRYHIIEISILLIKELVQMYWLGPTYFVKALNIPVAADDTYEQYYPPNPVISLHLADFFTYDSC